MNPPAMKKRVNLKFAGCLLGLLLVAAPGTHFLHAYQVRRNAGVLLDQADFWEKKGDLSQAAFYLGNYLSLEPGNVDVLARYAKLLANDELAKSYRARLRAYDMLGQVLRRAPDREDVRRQVVTLGMSLRRYGDALDHLENLIALNPEDGTLHCLAGRCHEFLGQYRETGETRGARSCYEKAIACSPTDIENYGRLAQLLLRHSDQVLRDKESARTIRDLADKTMDDMVTANPQSFQALLARVRLRKEAAAIRGIDANESANQKDIANAQQLAPDEADVILATAELAQDQNEPDKARQCLALGCKKNPDERRLYQALARLELRERQFDAAVKCLRDGLKACPGSLDLRWDLADVLLYASQNEEAREEISQLEKLAFPAAHLDYLRARIHINKEEWYEAARLLERAYPTFLANINQEYGQFFADTARQTDLLLGRCYEQLGDADRAYQTYSRLVGREPNSLQGRLGMAMLQASMGRYEAALVQYRQLMQLYKAPLSGFVEIARLVLRHNLEIGRPNWDEVDDALKVAERLEPLPVDVVLLRAESLARQKKYPEAVAKLLKDRGDEKSRPVEIWIGLAGIEQLQGRSDKALELLDQAEKLLGDQAKLRLARIRHWATRDKAQAAEPLAKMGRGLEKFKRDEQRFLRTELANASLRIGDSKEAERLWGELAARQKNDLRSRVVLFDLALEASNEEGMRRQINDIRRIENGTSRAGQEGNEGSLWRYARVCLLLYRAKLGEDAGMKELNAEVPGLLASIAVQRSTWSRVPLCEAQLADLNKDEDTALAHYLRAIQMGERGPQTLRRAIELLYARNRSNEAYQLLGKLPDTTSLAPGFQYVAAEVALKSQDTIRALSFAERAVSATSKDYRQHLWQGHLLQQAGQPEKATVAFYRARELAPDVPDTWVVLVRHLAATGQKDKAQAELVAAEKKLTGSQAALALAKCNEILGRTENARKYYQAALAANPEEEATLWGISQFLVNQGDFQSAEPHLRKLYKSHKESEAGRWARRGLAVYLALNGDYQRTNEALALLTEETSTKPSPDQQNTDRRTRAQVLVLQRTRSARREALRELEALIDSKAADDADYLLTAQLWESVGDWPKAVARLSSLRARSTGDRPWFLVYEALAMLRHGAVNQARAALDKLQTLEPDTWRTREVKARVLKAEGKGPAAVEELRGYANGNRAALVPVALLLEELGEATVAEEMYRAAVKESNKPQSIFDLVHFLRRRHRYQEALDLCDQSWQSCPPEAALQASLFVLAEAKPSVAQFARVDARLQAAIGKNPKSATLLLGLAALRNFEGRYEDAETVYRRILQADPSSATALNNLAWLLSLRKGKEQEALSLIENALSIAGPKANILDTRATIYLAMGRTNAALKDLEEIVLELPTATTYFHLTQARHLAGQRKEASDAWKKAKELGLGQDSLTPLERPIYQQLSSELDSR
jgi:tetratricopeptide (TPR) repeat protein